MEKYKKVNHRVILNVSSDEESSDLVRKCADLVDNVNKSKRKKDLMKLMDNLDQVFLQFFFSYIGLI